MARIDIITFLLILVIAVISIFSLDSANKAIGSHSPIEITEKGATRPILTVTETPDLTSIHIFKVVAESNNYREKGRSNLDLRIISDSGGSLTLEYFGEEISLGNFYPNKPRSIVVDIVCVKKESDGLVNGVNLIIPPCVESSSSSDEIPQIQNIGGNPTVTTAPIGTPVNIQTTSEPEPSANIPEFPSIVFPLMVTILMVCFFLKNK